MLVGKQLGTKKTFKRYNIEPWWKRRVESDIKSIISNMKILEKEKQGS